MITITKDMRKRLYHARKAINRAMSRDRAHLFSLLARWQAQPNDELAQTRFHDALDNSCQRRKQRATQEIAVSVDESLPIAALAPQIMAHIRHHQVLVLAGETGSGKTTQLPKLCLAAGRGQAGLIGCTQPRRIAARTVAARVAAELNSELGTVVGYQVRFTDKLSADNRIKFMTDGILLAETAADRWLSQYDTLIIDEAHERSLNIDFLLGYLKTLLVKRPDLKLIITSATIDTERFAAHFNNAPIIHVEGRTWPVSIRYRPRESNGLIDSIIQTVDEISAENPYGDILVFLSGEREIRDTHHALVRRNYLHTEILPLYARLSAKDQDRVFNPGPQRRVVLATNVAETSLTVPRIRYVIDPGFARIKRYSSRQKLDRLHIEPISQASANQRSGRCGRVAEGVCYRLYDDIDFNARPAFTDPEIQRASLAGVILKMLQLRLGAIEDFPFLQPPESRAIADGWQQLLELGAIDKQRKLTAIGREMASLPIDVKLARMLVAAKHNNCLHALLIIVSFLGVSDPRERPPEQRAAADQAHAQFNDNNSEFVGILRLWQAYKTAHEELTQHKLWEWCQQHFLGFLRMREWRELHRQLHVVCQELGWNDTDDHLIYNALISIPNKIKQAAPKISRGQLHRAARLARENKAPLATSSAPETAVEVTAIVDPKAQAAAYQTVHRAILTGLPTQIGQRTERGDYQAPRQRRFQVFPGSALAKKPPAWIISATLLDTQKIWGICNAAIEPQWIMQELAHVLSHKTFEPRWSPTRGQVMASEQVSLFGLIIEAKKPIAYGPIHPEHAHELMVQEGIISGQIKIRADFVDANLNVLEQAKEEEARLRRNDMIRDEQWQKQWYLQRIPNTIHSAKALDAWWKQLSPSQRQALYWSLDEVLPQPGSNDYDYPPHFMLGKTALPLYYQFEPGTEEDGISLDLPLHLLPALNAAQLSWLVPGLVAEKAESLIRSLPKNLRRNYVPAPEFARAFAESYPQPSMQAMEMELADFLSKITGSRIESSDFDLEQLPIHLQINLRIFDAQGQLLIASRNVDELKMQFAPAAQQAFSYHAHQDDAAEIYYQFPHATAFESVITIDGLTAWPALQPHENGVIRRLFSDQEQARKTHAQGVKHLLKISLSDKIKQAQKQLPLSARHELYGALLQSPQQWREDVVQAALQAILADYDNAMLERLYTPEDFADLCNKTGKKLFAKAMELLQSIQTCLQQYTDIKLKLKNTISARASCVDIQQQLDNLIYPDFLNHTPAQHILELPRYLKAIAIRLERAIRDPQRDEKRSIELQPFIQALHKAKQQGMHEQAAWQRLRWDMEELRVSLFAQELGTRHSISIKKLQQHLQNLM